MLRLVVHINTGFLGGVLERRLLDYVVLQPSGPRGYAREEEIVTRRVTTTERGEGPSLLGGDRRVTICSRAYSISLWGCPCAAHGCTHTVHVRIPRRAPERPSRLHLPPAPPHLILLAARRILFFSFTARITARRGKYNQMLTTTAVRGGTLTA